ncbi:MAG: CRISPR-associated endonuclease Cas2 [Phycisphaeraceae bacterium]
MPRRHYLITYDIASGPDGDKRRTRLFNLLEGEGDHAQFSVFFCDLSPAELANLRARTTQIIHEREDQILILDLGPAERSLDQNLEVVGKPYAPLTRVLVV